MTDAELKTAEELRELGKKRPEDSALLLRAATEIENLVMRLDAMWQDYRWIGD